MCSKNALHSFSGWKSKLINYVSECFIAWLVCSWSLKMKVVRSSEISSNYARLQAEILRELSIDHIQSSENFKSE
jgi:hypothetical protein